MPEVRPSLFVAVSWNRTHIVVGVDDDFVFPAFIHDHGEACIICYLKSDGVLDRTRCIRSIFGDSPRHDVVDVDRISTGGHNLNAHFVSAIVDNPSSGILVSTFLATYKAEAQNDQGENKK